MRACQWKAGLRVVERGIRPLDRGVTLFACRREARMWHRRSRAVKILLMAGNAGRDRDLVVVVDMAVRAHSRRIHMRTRQRKVGPGVVEGRGRPTGISGVTRFASLRKTAGHVIWIFGIRKILHVASHTWRSG